MGSANIKENKDSHLIVDERYGLTDWVALPGVKRILPKKCDVLPEEQQFNYFTKLLNFFQSDVPIYSLDNMFVIHDTCCQVFS